MIFAPPLGSDKQFLDTRRGNAKVRAMYHMPFMLLMRAAYSHQSSESVLLSIV